MITTEAWVLPEYTGSRLAAGEALPPAVLQREAIAFADITEQEVLVEPLYGSWESNMTHALNRSPIDICRARKEERVVLGNSGVVRVLRTGAQVRSIQAGDICMLFAGLFDAHGFLRQGQTFGYDAPGSVGLLARQTKLHHSQLLPIPKDSRFSLPQWAIFSLRYLTAYNNWNLAYGCYRLQMSNQDMPQPWVFGWGGGSTLAELELAKIAGCKVAMFASHPDRLALLRRRGIHAIDRKHFPALYYDDAQYQQDAAFRQTYLAAEQAFFDYVQDITQGQGVAIFIDYIGAPVTRASLRVLGRQGVLTTAGWKVGMKISTMRAIECIERHTHVHTHYARLADGLPSMELAERTGWMPEPPAEIYPYEAIPALAQRYAAGEVNDYFPVYQVNSV